MSISCFCVTFNKMSEGGKRQLRVRKDLSLLSLMPLVDSHEEHLGLRNRRLQEAERMAKGL